MNRLRRNRAWKLLWSGQAVSIVGDFVFQTTVVLWIGTVIAKGQSWAPAAVSGVLMAAAVPAIVVGPLAGVFVDRWDRRRIMLTSDACRAVLVAALLPLAWPSVSGHLSGPARLAVIYAVVAGMTFGPYDTIFGIAGLFFIAGGLAAIRPLRASSPRVAQAAQPPAGAVT